ncbi:MAG: carboxypeptidase regulatory-like domain-containing protein [Hyphomicrobiales bacterium]|nr:carboxypeptidase regulatory-like domain-containing protein [Hyphomicrobiales bacterium]
MKYTKSFIKLSLLIAFTFITFSINSSEVLAEQTTGIIRGSVTDESGNPVSGASVQITHIPSGSKSSTSSGNSGAFYSRGLRLGGPFKVTVTKSGQSSVRNNIFTRLGSESSLSFSLGSKSVEEIVVTAKASDFSGLGVGPGSTFNAEDISTLPSIDRDIKDIAKLDPFVTVDNNDQLSFGGGMPRLIGFIIDGVSANDSYGLSSNAYPTNRMPLSIDVIDQVSVKIANFDAELGEASSGNIVLTTKAGTNDFHGSFTIESSQTSGDEPFGEKADNADPDTELFSIALQGPIIKDKLFFSFGYEKYEASDPIQMQAFQSGLVTKAEADEVIQAAKDVIGYDAGSYNKGLEEEDEKTFLRIDANVTDNQALTLEYIHVDGFTESAYWNRSFALPLSSDWYKINKEYETIKFELNSDWSDNFSTRIMYSDTDVMNPNTPVGSTSIGEVGVGVASGGTVFFGPDQYRHANEIQTNRKQFEVAGYYDIGDHAITLGYKKMENDMFNMFSRNSLGEYDYNSLEDFIAGNLRELDYRNADTNNPRDAAGRFNMDYTIIYLQDTWNISSDLTARFGIRYEEISQDTTPEYNSFWFNWTGDDFRPAPRNDVNLDGEDIIMPRFSLDWQAKDNILVTFGWGEFSGNLPPVWFGGPYIDTGLGLPGNKLRARSNNLPTPGTPASYPGNAALALVQNEIGDTGGYTAMMDKDFGIPSITKMSLGVVADLDSGVTIRANYIHMEEEDPVGAYIGGCDPKGNALADNRPLYGGCSYVGYLTTFKNIQPETDIFGISMEKTFDNGLNLYLGYAHTSREMAHMMTSSIIFSSAVRMPLFDHLNPVNSPSHYEIEHSFDYALTWKGNVFGDLETSIGLNGFRQSGNPFSYTYRGDMSGYRTDGENIELLYVPSINDPNVIFSDGFDLAAFEQFLTDSGLSAYRGFTVPRNSFNSPWAGTFDLRIAQQLPSGGIPGKAIFYFDIENVLNLLNSDWGGFENYTGSTSNSRGIVEAEVDDQGRYVYKTFKVDGEPTQNIGKSVWQIKVGFKYQF